MRLPYHKPKQKSLKDFLNRQKVSTEYQASLTGSKKLLHKAWQVQLKIYNLMNDKYLIIECNFTLCLKFFFIKFVFISFKTLYNLIWI